MTVEQRRNIAINTENLFGFDSKLAIKARGLVYDANDYISGPSDTAEKCARYSGYWNLVPVHFELNRLCDAFMAEEKKEVGSLTW